MAEQFNFNISLSVLNHLGRNLYRNFITVLGEAISNSWDAEAENVWITIDENGKYFSIKDDGIGMNGNDFQEKFLKIGYSKRKTGESLSPNKNRPYIGRKGVGKLALLSCAQRIHITSKTNDTAYIGGIIDNRELDEAITDDSNPEDCPLGLLNEGVFGNLKRDHEHGTIIHFENINEGINNNIETLRRLIAMHFRFSLIDPSFSIFVNDEKVGFEKLAILSKNTEFLWTINEFSDPFLKTLRTLKERLDVSVSYKDMEGFIASVEKPSHLNIFGSGEKTGIDVFVNGRLRETNILKHAPAFATRIIASYLYGQIHLNILDGEGVENPDRFTTSREGIKPEDALYKKLLDTIKNEIFSSLSTQWDIWRTKHREDGDTEEGNTPKYQRKLVESKNARDEDFEEKIDYTNLDDRTKTRLKETLRGLSHNNTQIYQDLFILENLFRAFLKKRGISDKDRLLSDFPKNKEIEKCVEKLLDIKKDREIKEETHALKGKIVETEHDLNYLDLEWLGILVDKIKRHKTGRHEPPTMESHTKEIVPVRNAVMHTNEVSQDVMHWDKINNIIDYMDKLTLKP